jgi:hypothetical protein
MMKEYEAARPHHPLHENLRTLYDDEGVQNKIRQAATRLYEENTAVQAAIRETEELFLPSVSLDDPVRAFSCRTSTHKVNLHSL